MKFLCDQMLGTLAKWLRILGYDTFYANAEITDEKLTRIAEDENRILITRDKQLINKAKKKNLSHIGIKTTDLKDQLSQVLKNIDFIDEKILLSRCTICNTLLKTVEKKEVEEKVPKKVFENNDKFWFCQNCDKYYWTGSHYDKIIRQINSIKKDKRL